MSHIAGGFMLLWLCRPNNRQAVWREPMPNLSLWLRVRVYRKVSSYYWYHCRSTLSLCASFEFICQFLHQ
jgi:hypothetical protein